MNRLHFCLSAVLFFTVLPAVSGQPTFYNGTNATGQLVLTRTVNATQAASAVQFTGFSALRLSTMGRDAGSSAEIPKEIPRRPPPVLPEVSTRKSEISIRAAGARMQTGVQAAALQSLTVVSGGASIGFDGLTHRDQRLANNGNQYSVEPPNPSIAVGNGYILEGVNNAVQVYNLAGQPLLPNVLSSNQLFGVAPAINRTTGFSGVFPTDMRVFYDANIDRWFVMQRAQNNDIFGNYLATSNLYLAVSRTGDPTGTYNIYVMDTTNWSYPGCPCVGDYPQIGADQYGIYVSANQYQSLFDTYVAASILAISKTGLEQGAAAPAAFHFNIPFTRGDEFTIQPAVTPPGGSYFLANGGVEFFVSTATVAGNSVALWALSNTSSLITEPQLLLTRIGVPTQNYSSPPVATQPPGFRPYGSSLVPPGQLPFIESGDTRALSLMYAAGRLYVAVASRVTDEAGRSLAGGAYIVLSPTIRKGALAGSVVQQGYLAASNNHLLFPAMAVNAQGRGVIAATLVGPDWYPSTVFVPFTTFSTPSTLHVVGLGLLPQDGFTGYDGDPSRWGDYSAAVVSTDGSLWIASEYIGNLPRTEFANWQTFIAQFNP